MELLMSAKLEHSKFHGTAHVSKIGTFQVQWNFMELLMSAKLAHSKRTPWNSMEFCVTARINEIDALQVPWNSMELLMSAKLALSYFHAIPWIFLI